MFTIEMMSFMLAIRFNNNKAFMDANRKEYIRRMRDPYYQLIDSLAPTMLKIDPNMETRPAKCLSRIFRDTRFSKDKSPYRDHHWVAFRRKGEQRDQAVMFWFEIKLESVSWGMGFWGENKPAMEVFRRRMAARPDEILSLLPTLTERQFQLEGARYSRMIPPETLPEELRTWYTKREIYLVKQNINPEWVFQPDITDRLSDDYLALEPFYRLFRGCSELADNTSGQSSVQNDWD